MVGVYTDVPLKDYQTIIQDAFRDSGTPASFTPTTAKLSALARNWLTQQQVKRQAILLLGFGLKMSVEEVNELLYKRLHEPLLNDQNPLESICKYCYQHGYGYHKFQKLWQTYEQAEPDELNRKLVYHASPGGRTESHSVIHDDSQLMNSLIGMKKQNGDRLSDVIYDRFLSLYNQARDLIVIQYNAAQIDEGHLLASRLREKLQYSDRM